jgi:hypothetical protein
VVKRRRMMMMMMMMIRPYLLTLHTKSCMKRKEDCTFLLVHMTVVIFNLRYSSACFNSILLVRPFFVDYWPTPCIIQFGQSLFFFFCALSYTTPLISRLIASRTFIYIYIYKYIDSSFVQLVDWMSKWCHTWNLGMCEMKRDTT